MTFLKIKSKHHPYFGNEKKNLQNCFQICQELMFEDNHDIEVNGLWDTNTKRGLQVFLHQQAGGNRRGWKEALTVGKMHSKILRESLIPEEALA